PPEIGAQTLEPALVDAASHELLELALAPAGHVEGGLPVPEGALAVGHALELRGRDIAAHGQGRVQDAVGGQMLLVGQGEELLPDQVAVTEAEAADTAHPGRG